MQFRSWKTKGLIVVALVVAALAIVEYRRVAVLNDRLGCTAYWLEQTKSLHQAQMMEAENFTADMMRKLMGSVDSAYDCATKEPSLGHPPGGGSFGQYGILPQK